MVNITGIAAPLDSLVSPVQGLISTLEVILGGIFGLYLVFIVFRLYYSNRANKILKDILEEVRHISHHMDRVKKSKRK